MRAVLRDIRYGARSLRKSRAVTAVAILALTLGIGLTTTMFSIVYGALLKGMPFPDPDRLATVQRQNLSRGIQRMPTPIHDFQDYRTQQRSFSGIAAFHRSRDLNCRDPLWGQNRCRMKKRPDPFS